MDAQTRRVEAVALVHWGSFGLIACEDDVDAAEKSTTMPRCLDDLDRRQVTLLGFNGPGERNMRQTDCAVVGLVRGTGEVEHWDHDGGEV